MVGQIDIPVNMKELLRWHGIEYEDIIYTAVSDMTLNHRFADGGVFLTKTCAAVVRGKQENGDIHGFGGYAPKFIEKKHGESEVIVYRVEDIKEFNVIRQVNGGMLFATIENGADVVLLEFSNSRMEGFDRLCRIFRKMKEGKELTEDDFKGRVKFECCPKCGTLYPNQERKVCPKCTDKRSLFFRVLSYFKPYKLQIGIMMLCFLFTALLNLAWPYLNGRILYDRVLAKDAEFLEFVGLPAGKFTVLLGFVVLTMVFCKIVNQILSIIHGVMVAKIVPGVVRDIKADVFKSMGKLSISFYNNRETGGLMTRVLSDANEVTTFFIDCLPFFFVHGFTIISTCIVMFSLNVGLAAVSLVLLPFLVVISVKMLPRLWSIYGRRHRANRSMNGQINDNITGARVVKAFGQEQKEVKRFGNYNGRVRDTELSVVAFDNRFYALYTAVQQLATFVVWGVGGVMIIGRFGMEFGLLVTFIGYVSELRGPLEFMSRCFRMYTASMNSAQRIFEIIDAVPEILESDEPIRPDYIRGEIELNNVTFGYEANKPVLENISFHVNAGEVLGIVGRSGAGKSTLVNLISRLYDPQEGSILIDGIDIKDMGFEELRRSVAMVSQETYIFMGTVAENIAYAKPDASYEEIVAAAVRASAHDFICKMPDGYDTMLGSSGRTLSGGERQRISIARAILANPRILILDEATASVDTETEQAIQASLEELVKGRTTLSIAHRLSTLNNADYLLVIDDGKIAEKGTHRELIEKKGIFHKLMQLQTKALAMRGIE
ncbi:MAG: ABC transporter ATP-binding protein [Lachnospiraceae bacterium]|nr:ABC transporter ATP-binding protein [Lachnospiraceae bacterium]